RLRVRRVYHDPRRFVDREQVMVFEKDVERCGIRLDPAREGESGFGNIHRQHVAGRDSRRDAANGFAIDADGSSIDPRLNPGSRGCVEIRKMSAEHEIQPLTRVAAVAEKSADGRFVTLGVLRYAI